MATVLLTIAKVVGQHAGTSYCLTPARSRRDIGNGKGWGGPVVPVAAAVPARLTAVVMISALLTQFVLGMYINLYVTVPKLNFGGGSAGMMPGMGGMMAVAFDPALWVHMLLGMALVPLGIVQVVAASSSPMRAVALPLAATGLVFVLVAGYGGVSFLMGGQQNGASLVMAVGFVCAFTAYFSELALTSRG